MADKIQIRRDTAANWTSVDPILSDGEQGYETDTRKIKIGDGATAWTSLGYNFESSGGDDSLLPLEDMFGLDGDLTNAGSLAGATATTEGTFIYDTGRNGTDLGYRPSAASSYLRLTEAGTESSDFFIGFWCKAEGYFTGSGTQIVPVLAHDSLTGGYIEIGYPSFGETNSISIMSYISGGSVSTSNLVDITTLGLAKTDFIHYAVQRSGDVLTVFLNGSQVGQITLTGSYTFTDSWRLNDSSFSSYVSRGVWQDVYISSEAVIPESGSFDPETFVVTVPGYGDTDVDTHLNTSTATTGQVLSYTGTDYDWIDAGGGDVKLYADTPYVGSNGLHMINDPDFAIGADDFYFELKFWMPANTLYGNIFSLGVDATYKYGEFTAYKSNNSDGRLTVISSSTGNTTDGTLMLNNAFLGANRFVNLILARSSNTVSLYIDGVRRYNGNPAEITTLTADNLSFFKYADNTEIMAGGSEDLYHQAFVFEKGRSVIDVSDTTVKTKLGIDVASGAETLDDLTDVDLTTTPPSSGQFFSYNGTKWVPAAAPSDFTNSTRGAYTFKMTPSTSIAIGSATEARIAMGSDTSSITYSDSGAYKLAGIVNQDIKNEHISTTVYCNPSAAALIHPNDVGLLSRYGAVSVDYQKTQYDTGVNSGGIGSHEFRVNNSVVSSFRHSGTTLNSAVISVPNLPTADPLVAGQLWNDAGTLKISAG